MSALGLETNQYQDYAVLPGTTFARQFNVVPLDLTGATAQITVEGIGTDGADVVGDVTLTVEDVGVNAQTNFAWSFSATQTIPWKAGSYRYKLFVTLVDGITVLPYGTGRVIVRNE